MVMMVGRPAGGIRGGVMMMSGVVVAVRWLPRLVTGLGWRAGRIRVHPKKQPGRGVRRGRAAGTWCPPQVPDAKEAGEHQRQDDHYCQPDRDGQEQNRGDDSHQENNQGWHGLILRV